MFIENKNQRILDEAKYILQHNATVRKTAKAFLVGKSTVHKDVTVKLYYLDANLYRKVKAVLKTNLEERHIRGGLATKKRYQKINEIKKEIALTK